MTPTPINERGYTRPELLADANWVATHLDDPQIRIIDARQALPYEAGHIPGAVSLVAHGAIPRTDTADIGSQEQFDELARELGISKGMTVVTYDTPSAATGMLAWAFLYFGHPDVRMLDGGYDKWEREARPISTEVPDYPAGNFAGSLEPGLLCTLDQAKAAVGRAGTVLWDTRTEAEYEGTNPPNPNSPPRLGRIPGSVHLEWVDLLDPDWKTFKPAGELMDLLNSRGITPESEIDCY